MTTFELVRAKAEAAHNAAGKLAVVSAAVKNKALLAMADALLAKTDFIIEANNRDMQAAKENGMRESMQDRLRLTPERIAGMAEGLQQVAALHRRANACQWLKNYQSTRAAGRYRHYLRSAPQRNGGRYRAVP